MMNGVCGGVGHLALGGNFEKRNWGWKKRQAFGGIEVKHY